VDAFIGKIIGQAVTASFDAPAGSDGKVKPQSSLVVMLFDFGP
jgi:hypothetical protein